MKKITMVLAFLLAFVTEGYAQFPEDFEGATFPPAGWASFGGANGAGAAVNWAQDDLYAASPIYSAFISYDAADAGTTKEDWLVTPAVTISAGAPALTFQQRQQYTVAYNSVYTVRVSTTSQTDIATFTTVSSETEATMPLGAFGAKMVDLSAYVGQTVYIAFVMANDDGDNWFIDDVAFTTLVPVPSCASTPSPADAATAVPYGPITLSWTAPTGEPATSYDLYAGDAPDALTFVGNYTDTNTGVGLQINAYNATVYWQVVPKNDGGSATGCSVWSFTTESSPGFCLNGDLYPPDPATLDTCDGVTENLVVDDAYAGEYSVIPVTSGQQYVFKSSIGTDFITISDIDGLTSLAAGTTPLSWTSNLDGEIRFYIHLDDQCGTEAEPRVKTVICGTPSADAPDYAALQWPPTMTLIEGNTGDVYGQVYEPGVTEPEGQGAGITAWVGVSDSNTNPNTWAEASWTEMAYNATCGGCGNNDEYFGPIGAGLAPGTYYYAVRFRLNAGAYVYGGHNGVSGNFWDGTTFISGVLTVDPAPAPANDECAGAIALTPGVDFAAGALTTTNVGATSTAAASCQASSDESVWYSVVVPASGSITIETGDVAGSLFDDSVITVFSGDCATLTEVDCDDDSSDNGLFSLIELTGREPGETLYISVWRYTGAFATGDWGQFQISAYDASLGINQFNSNDFAVYPNPVKNVLNLTSNLADISNVAVYNLLGQQVIAKPINASQGQIDMSSLPQGTYMVKVTANNQVKTMKVIKE